MRSLAIARLRLLTRIRTASVFFALAAAPALPFVLVASWPPENEYRAGFPFIATYLSGWSVLVFILHLGVMMIGSETSGQLHPQREGTEWSDLMETIPIGPTGRFWGELLGNLGINLTIHLCCLPLLALVAVVSPLPISVFLIVELLVLFFLFMAAAAAAWKRCAAPTKWSGTRMARSGMLFWILFVLILNATARWESIPDALDGLWMRPSPTTWRAALAVFDRPVQFVVLVTLLCLSYLTFYYVSSVRGITRRRRI